MKRIRLMAVFALAIGILLALVVSADTVTDIDGNVYQTVTIGSQVWTAENLRVTHYNNGDSIPIVVPDTLNWTGITTGLSCVFNNDTNNIAPYGRLYNWYATIDSRNLAPTEWHVPSDSDWVQLEVFLGMPVDLVWGTGYRGGSPVGAKLKEVGTTHWACPNNGTTNLTGFSARGGGDMDNRPIFNELGGFAFFWASTEFSPGSTAAWARDLPCSLPFIGRGGYGKDYGGYIRCIRNAPADIGENNGQILPNEFRLVQNYPNPFNPTTSIEYNLPGQSRVTLEIFNILGQKIRTLENQIKPAGSYRIEWNGTDDAGETVTSGIYTYRLNAGDVVRIKKMSLIK
jgi:uncharacterized protein (TIGR02145 family)